MITQAPTDLLAPYVVAAARQVLDGRDLSDRSRWAVDDARAQLQDSKQAIDGGSHASPAAGRAALVAASTGSSLELATLALASRLDPQPPASIEEHEEKASAVIGRLLNDLDQLLEGDVTAAAEVRDVFQSIIGRLATLEGDTFLTSRN